MPTAYLIAKTERRSIMVLRTHKVSKLLHNACNVCLFAPLNHDVKKNRLTCWFWHVHYVEGGTIICTLSAQFSILGVLLRTNRAGSIILLAFLLAVCCAKM